MFWKNAKVPYRKSLSLVTKLMMLYSLSTLGLLGSICLFLYPTFNKVMEKLNGTPASELTIECFKQLIITLLMASLATIIVGHITSRNGLKRLREFEDNMEKISVNSLDNQILIQEWPKELKPLALKFNEMLARIQTSFTQLSQFSSDIAHELRTPIHNLKNITETALLKKQSNEEYIQVLESSMQEYQHLTKLVENMLFMARSDHGQISLKTELIDAKKEITFICDYYQPLADEQKITLTCSGNAKISGDLILFKRVITNLISNALRHTSAHGKIDIRLQSIEKGVYITIQDTGTGIASEHINQLCNRFYRVDSARSHHSGGAGLGLAMVKSIMDLHHGTIKIESTPGVGTSVHLQFPL